MKTRRNKLLLLLTAALALTAYAGKDEVSLRQGPHGVEAVKVSDLEFAITDEFDDGPYLRRNAEGIEASWICKGKVVRKQFAPAPVVVPPVCGYEQPITVRAPVPLDRDVAMPPLGKLIALSDPHGQYQTMRQLLLANRIIDDSNRWLLGDAQLMITGDVFDRGHQVSEIFWLLYGLEAQAQAAGGRLHFLLGNHEYMVLAGDLRYLNDKYVRAADLLGRDYPGLYDADTVLGQWLRSRDTIRQLGDMLFLHAGISADFFALNLSIPEANAHFRRSIGLSKAERNNDPILAALHASDGPVWYRGYFLDDDLQASQVQTIADKLGVKHLIVGHTSMPTVLQRFEQKVIAIDSSIKKGESGELLLVEAGQKWRLTMTGERLPL